MRFILVYKYGILQTKTERIDVNVCQETTQLFEYLEKKVKQKSEDFIVKFKKAKTNFRIIPGWPMRHYGLTEGTELQIELINSDSIGNGPINTNVNSKYLNSVLGLNQISQMDRQMPQIEEEDEQESKFNIRKYLDAECEKMLREIQKKNLHGFLQVFQTCPNNIDEDSLLQLQTRKPYIIDELGEKGWGSLHYAIFCSANEIFEELLQMEVDVNKTTSDGWLPIQLAINLKAKDMVERLINEPSMNLTLVTSRGSALHVAAKAGNKDILLMLLKRDIDTQIKDNSGKTASDICLDQEILLLLKKYEDRKEIYQEDIKGNLPLSLATITRGPILKAKRPFMNLKERYLFIDPFQGSFIRYESIQDFPKKSKEILPLTKIHSIQILEQNEKSWYMKKELVYFQISQTNKEIYACKYRTTAQKWINSINMAIKFALQFEKKPQLLLEVKKSEVTIEDRPEEDIEPNKKVKRNLFSMNESQSSLHVTNSYMDKSASKVENANQKTEEDSTKETPLSESQNKKEKDEIPVNINQELNEITTNKVNFASFTIIRVLGSGAFGKVFLVKHNATGNSYALKALKKKNLIMQKQLKYAITEANILKQANHPFIVNLHYAFQTPHYLYLALDYCPGRDLSFHIARQVTFTEEDAMFYTAELILAIEHLHGKKIIYRDLKPENILLDGSGHIRLADFGLSKQTENQITKSFCGSPAYLSPEMLNQKGAGKESDLYGIGAVLYEFLIGEPPYFSDDIPTLYRNIREGKLKFPKNISENGKNMIVGLLDRDPKKRLGAKGFKQVKQHPFFKTIDWGRLARVEINAPARPDITDSDGSEDELDIISKKNNFTDVDYDKSSKKVNRLINFSFVREE